LRIWEERKGKLIFMSKIAIVGYGFVGKGMHRLFGDDVMAIYDPFTDDLKAFPTTGTTKKAVNNCELAIVCVPTKEKADGSCDTSLVEEAIKWLKVPLILIKSTVEPGTTDKLRKKYKKNIAFSPEYMGEGKYFVPPWKYPDPREAKLHTFQIFGGPREVTKKILDIFVRVMGPHVFYAQTDAKTAEVVKYMINSWGAMKVTFANEWYDICEALGVDYREVRELWALDSRVEKMHTAVFPDKRGYGGKCFPKDVSAIIEATKRAAYRPKLMETIKSLNKEFSKKSKDE
jgi:UDPglucose 6-dehydrogenase